MNRLTKIQQYGVVTVCQGRHGDVTIWQHWEEGRADKTELALLKLAEYEDTGLEPSEIIKGKCKWTQYDKESTGMYETGCEHLFEINNGTPSENNMRYCCYCGKRIVEVRNMYDCGSCLHLDKTRKTEIKTAGEKSELKKMGCGAWVDRKESAE